MVADTMFIESQQHIDGRDRRPFICALLFQRGGGELGGKCIGKHIGYIALGPICSHAIRETGGIVDDEDVRFATETELFGALLEFFCADGAEAIGISCVAMMSVVFILFLSRDTRHRRTITQTQNLEMIPHLRPCQRQYRRRKEHSLIVRMRNQETYPLIV